MIGLIVVASQLLAAIVTGYVGKRDDVGLAVGPFEAGFHANFKAFERVDVPDDQVHLLKIPHAPETTQEAAERMDRSLMVLAFAHFNAQQRNQPTRETFLGEGLSEVETMSIREELREVAWLVSVITALSMLGIVEQSKDQEFWSTSTVDGQSRSSTAAVGGTSTSIMFSNTTSSSRPQNMPWNGSLRASILACSVGGINGERTMKKVASTMSSENGEQV